MARKPVHFQQNLILNEFISIKCENKTIICVSEKRLSHIETIIISSVASSHSWFQFTSNDKFTCHQSGQHSYRIATHYSKHFSFQKKFFFVVKSIIVRFKLKIQFSVESFRVDRVPLNCFSGTRLFEMRPTWISKKRCFNDFNCGCQTTWWSI